MNCPNCGFPGVIWRKLSDWEKDELVSRAHTIMAEHPPSRGNLGSRQHHLGGLANSYGITLRTLYRYLREAA